MKQHLRSLPRVFVPGASPEVPIELPSEEVDKLRKVLRLAAGAEIAVLPNDGSLIRCRFDNRQAIPLEQSWPSTEAKLVVTVAQALPKGDKLDDIVRALYRDRCSSVCFSSLATAQSLDGTRPRPQIGSAACQLSQGEACEISFRTRLPEMATSVSLGELLAAEPDAVVLSEAEGLGRGLSDVAARSSVTLVAGPEGGWSPRELEIIGSRGVTLGPRVLRVDHAAAAACAILLLAH